ncbi:YggS family pyridoxal phosphate-dependent enzyme [Pseudoroseicyclus tamaricis]|uniref:Pyridoxal phosphate homeostasis protein n=1 Tax=Pseudoroseicyclus tamaricis TaxID=2705421 RepID=A0A6B2JWQ7_9RHOB|nr:YggS family pyridoxal phosphate-dependent enzyme [Pseudoroseicyclus tamaricis]NDV02560.1 YggS family pyridoxal phosphate-dependent enzyme [Pseudoroseicyclus tamaricis]
MQLEAIRSRIDAASARAGRPEGSVRLIAVSKQQPADRIEAVLEAGHRVFGENRVQEAAGRWPELRERYQGVALHLLGPLQTNKARQAMELADSIHSLDRPKLAGTLARLAQEQGSCPDLFVQVNTGEEPQKAGVLPGEAEAFVRDCREMDLPVIGLMCIPPVEEDARAHFRMLRQMAEDLGLPELSMGMSGDFEVAVEEGATLVRVGSAIFGERPPRE